MAYVEQKDLTKDEEAKYVNTHQMMFYGEVDKLRRRGYDQGRA